MSGAVVRGARCFRSHMTLVTAVVVLAATWCPLTEASPCTSSDSCFGASCTDWDTFGREYMLCDYQGQDITNLCECEGCPCAGASASGSLSEACHPGWSYQDGSCYYFGNFEREGETPKMSWHACSQACTDSFGFLGAHMLGIVNSDQNKFVAASSDDAIWLGYSDAAEEGDWKWNADCPASTFTRWATAKDSGGQKKHDEPDNKKGNQDFAVLCGGDCPNWRYNKIYDTNAAGKWYDEDGDSKRQCGCQYELPVTSEPTPATPVPTPFPTSVEENNSTGAEHLRRWKEYFHVGREGSIWRPTLDDDAYDEYLCQCSLDGMSAGFHTTPTKSYDIVTRKSPYDSGSCGAHSRYAEVHTPFVGGLEYKWCYTIGGTRCRLNRVSQEGVLYWYPYTLEEKPGKRLREDALKVKRIQGDDFTYEEVKSGWRKCEGYLDCNVEQGKLVTIGTLHTTISFADSRGVKDWTTCCQECSNAGLDASGEPICTTWNYVLTGSVCYLYSSVKEVTTLEELDDYYYTFYGTPGWEDLPYYCMFRNENSRGTRRNIERTCTKNYGDLLRAGIILSILSSIALYSSSQTIYYYQKTYDHLAWVRPKSVHVTAVRTETRNRAAKDGGWMPDTYTVTTAMIRYQIRGNPRSFEMREEGKNPFKHTQRTLKIWVNAESGNRIIDSPNAPCGPPYHACVITSNVILSILALPGLLCLLFLCIQLIWTDGGRFNASQTLGNGRKFGVADMVGAKIGLTVISIVIIGIPTVFIGYDGHRLHLHSPAP
mmetsp:Transcript_42231/g.112725  ORF Transcript_42231/g.112725 Transcript_42231/m.112725 type:complete len:769 (-) Transcript_42231:298-2604(-)